MPFANWSQAVLPDQGPTGGFGLYLHWPFCTAKCPYCDFNSHVRKEIDQDQWLKAYLAEIDRAAEETDGRILTSVFFGGGTPSLMHPDIVAALIERIRTRWRQVNDCEITLEANPGSVEADRFRDFAQAGVNRISMGIQALNDNDLRKLGRIHTVADARRAFTIARENFDRVSFDLIYARQDQSLDDWQRELKDALTLSTDHLSLYQLTVEDGTAFGDRFHAGGLRGLPEDDLAADMYAMTQEICARAGLIGYEISNHAKVGSESRHNLIYWRLGDYIGIGPGAHGRLTSGTRRYATEAWRNPDRWLNAVGSGSGEMKRTALSRQETAEEFVMMGLRLHEGIDPARYRALSGRSFDPDTLTHLKEIDMIRDRTDRVIVTQSGRIVLNAVLRELLAG